MWDGCFEYCLKHRRTGVRVRVISNTAANACRTLDWLPEDSLVEYVHKTYGKVLERSEKEPALSKSTDDFEYSKVCF